MKGVVLNCLGKLVSSQFGAAQWKQVLVGAGKSKFTKYLHGQDILDQEVLDVLESVCKVLDLTLEQAADAFGHYWATEFAPALYGGYYAKAATARDFLLQLDEIHRETTLNVQNARPPRFDYEHVDDKTLIMTYKSSRGLIVIFEGLLRGLGAYYGETLELKRLGGNRVRIRFP